MHGSIRQSDGQRSLSLVLPSSHDSPGFGAPLPQPAGMVEVVDEVVVEVVEVVVEVVGIVDVVVDVVVVGTVVVVLVVAIVVEVVTTVDVVLVVVVDEVVDVLVVGAVDVELLLVEVDVVGAVDVVVVVASVVVVDDDPSPTVHVTPAIGCELASEAETTVQPNSPASGGLAPSQSSKWTRKRSPCGKEAPAATSSRSAWSRSLAFPKLPSGRSVMIPDGTPPPLPGMLTLPSG